MLTAIIVEDMLEAIQLLTSDLRTYCPDINITGTAGSVVHAAKLLRQEMPDIIFLDISLGDGTGFDLLEIFPDKLFYDVSVIRHDYYYKNFDKFDSDISEQILSLRLGISYSF